MKLITTTGYYGTGSSVITDLLSEYDGIHSLPCGFECRIAHDMFGLSDLEYYLVENNHRHNSSVAIKNFLRLMDIYGLNKYIMLENYPYHLGVSFKLAVEEYVKELAPVTFKGGAHTDIYNKDNQFIFFLKLKEKLFRTFHKYRPSDVDDDTWKNKKQTPYEKATSKETSFLSYSNESFLPLTKIFTSNIFAQFEREGIDSLMVDQLIPPSNTMRYIRYFDDIRAFVIDRDPRDLYYNEKYYWKGHVLPSNVNEFIQWYKVTRAHKNNEQDDKSRIMRMSFEELVYNYDESVFKIEEFLNLSSSKHLRKKERFNPDISIKNIGKWKYDSKEFDNISKIERELIYNV